MMRTLLAWDSATAKSKGIYGFDSLDARSRPFNMIPRQAARAPDGARLAALRRRVGYAQSGQVASSLRMSRRRCSRDPRFRTTVIDLDLRRASLDRHFQH